MVFIHEIWERNKSEWFTIYLTRFFVFFKRCFEGDKNWLVELHNIIRLLLQLRAKLQVLKRVS